MCASILTSIRQMVVPLNPNPHLCREYCGKTDLILLSASDGFKTLQIRSGRPQRSHDTAFSLTLEHTYKIKDHNVQFESVKPRVVGLFHPSSISVHPGQQGATKTACPTAATVKFTAIHPTLTYQDFTLTYTPNNTCRLDLPLHQPLSSLTCASVIGISSLTNQTTLINPKTSACHSAALQLSACGGPGAAVVRNWATAATAMKNVEARMLMIWLRPTNMSAPMPSMPFPISVPQGEMRRRVGGRRRKPWMMARDRRA